MKPHTRTPQIWCGYDPNNLLRERLRILYPDGRSTYALAPFVSWETSWYESPVCWQKFIGGVFIPDRRIKSFPKRIKLMKNYDRLIGLKTEFLGNV